MYSYILAYVCVCPYVCSTNIKGYIIYNLYMLLALKLNVVIVIRNRKKRNLNVAYYALSGYAQMVELWAVSLTFFLVFHCLLNFLDQLLVLARKTTL